MREKIFKFKQFSVKNDLSAMKVGTDGVLIGSWTDVSNDIANILDIGTGTGLIALMLAQRTSCNHILGIELDKKACQEAEENVSLSPWNGRIEIMNVDFIEFLEKNKTKFDLIVSNPPFFSTAILAPDLRRATARHNSNLTLNELIKGASSLLSDKGRFSFIYPYADKDLILNTAGENGLYATKITSVYPTVNSIPKRVLIELSKMRKETLVDSLIIEIDRHKYTSQYKELTKIFYLNM